MGNDRREELMREAAEIFFKLRDDPDNAELLARRDAFMARGKEEQATYEHLLKTWKASGVMRAPKTLRTIILLCVGLLGATAFTYDPIRIAILADLSTRGSPEQSTLTSGDVAFLDAETALVDETDGAGRAVRLLEGAAFFEVESGARPFTVEVGEVVVTVVGTEFETAFVDDTVLVNVAEGRVDVWLADQTWKLEAGDQFMWSNERGASISEQDAETVASWRDNRLVVDGLTFGQAAAIIERRLSGHVIIASSALRDTPVAGNIDLSEPLRALRLLADLIGGRVYHAPGIGRVVASR